MTGPSLEPHTNAMSSGDVHDDRVARLAARSAARREALSGSAGSSGSRSTGRRRHAARGSRIAALALSLTSTLGLGAYLRHAARSSASSIPVVSATPSPTTTRSASGSATPTPAAPPQSSSDPASSTGLTDGTYTGSVSSNRWGDVQVQIAVADGTITKVDVLRYPDHEGPSIAINQSALPILISETLSAQSASVDTVSGATYTSTSYRQSLQSAIDQASRTSGTG